MKRHSYFAFTVIIIVFSLPGIIFANGLGGQRLEKNTGRYIVDIGTDQEFTPQAGTPIRFDFNLLNADTRAYHTFSDVEVMLTAPDGRPLLDSDLVFARSGPTFITYTFPQNGTYKLRVTFFDGGDNPVADATFDLMIEGGTPFASNENGTSGTRYFIFGSVLGILIGIVVGTVMNSRFRKNNTT